MEIINIPNQIIKSPLVPLDFSKIDTIALHHMACEGDVKSIERAHINNGWRAIGYNFWVGKNGDVYKGRGFNVGAGVENHNGHVISVGFQGDYSKNQAMPDAQFNAGAEIVNHIIKTLNKSLKICGHRDITPTACPGEYFPLEEMKLLKKREKAELKEVNDIVWELWARGIITDKKLWLKKLKADENVYWLARKIANKH